ncbi:TetR family transcriptional regulator [Flavobacterium okayamense]|uniref:TetR family transcriptional regulator n=2 Tax=Flavobacterium okayamense TaxID=2830782 RepID=A0ABM7S9F5_9FLAO|nr:TetR family transcriptional regulator [Flavobacterium okayamense]
METFFVLKVSVIFLWSNSDYMKEQILEKATEMFLTLGFKSVTMDDIAAELGISKKTIYQHYATKPELVKSVTLHLFDTISCGIDQICAVGKNPIEELFTIKNFVLEHLKNEAASPFYQLNKYYPKIYLTLKKKQFGKMSECVLENLKRGIEDGLFRKEINPEIVGRFYFAGMNSLKDEELFPRNQFNTIETQEHYLEYHLRGICTSKGIKIVENLINNN